MKHRIALVCALACLAAGRAHAVELYPDGEGPTLTLVIAPMYVPPAYPMHRVIVRDDGSRDRVVTVDLGAPRFTIGAAVGAWIAIGDQERVAPIAHVHVGFDLEGAELALRAGISPAISDDLGLYTVEAAFVYRFLPNEMVHPYLGAGLGAAIASDGAPSIGFDVSVRAGVELAADLGEEGELGVGVDAIGTQVAFADDRFPWELGTSITTSVHVEYRR